MLSASLNKTFLPFFTKTQHFLPFSESPMAMTPEKVQCLFLPRYCQVWLSCRPVGLQSKFFAIRFPVIKCAISIEFNYSTAHRCFGASQFGSNVQIYPSPCK